MPSPGLSLGYSSRRNIMLPYAFTYVLYGQQPRCDTIFFQCRSSNVLLDLFGLHSSIQSPAVFSALFRLQPFAINSFIYLFRVIVISPYYSLYFSCCSFRHALASQSLCQEWLLSQPLPKRTGRGPAGYSAATSRSGSPV